MLHLTQELSVPRKRTSPLTAKSAKIGRVVDLHGQVSMVDRLERKRAMRTLPAVGTTEQEITSFAFRAYE